MKKFFIILGISVAVLAVALTLIIVLSRSVGKPADDPDCRFTYTFTEKENGILVTVKGAPDEGCSWQLMTDGLSSVSVGDFKTDSKKTTFLVTPVSFGAQSVTLAMLADGADGAPDCRYTITVDFISGQTGGLSVLHSGHREYEGRRSFSSPDGHTYAYSFGPDGSLYVTISGTAGQYWSANPDRSGIVSAAMAEEQEEEADTALFRLAPTASGSVNVWFVGTDVEQAIVMTIENTSGVLAVTELTHTAYDAQQREQEKQQHDVEDRIGVITLPDGADMTSCGLFSLRDAMGIKWTPARVTFTLDGREWEYDAGLLGSPDTMRTYCGLSDEIAAVSAVDAYQAWVGTADDMVSIVWAHDDGCVFALRAADVTTEDLLTLAKQMDGLNPLTAESIMKLK